MAKVSNMRRDLSYIRARTVDGRSGDWIPCDDGMLREVIDIAPNVNTGEFAPRDKKTVFTVDGQSRKVDYYRVDRAGKLTVLNIYREPSTIEMASVSAPVVVAPVAASNDHHELRTALAILRAEDGSTPQERVATLTAYLVRTLAKLT